MKCHLSPITVSWTNRNLEINTQKLGSELISSRNTHPYTVLNE